MSIDPLYAVRSVSVLSIDLIMSDTGQLCKRAAKPVRRCPSRCSETLGVGIMLFALFVYILVIEGVGPNVFSTIRYLI